MLHVSVKVQVHFSTSSGWKFFDSYLSYELNDEVHHQFGVLVKHSLPQLVHYSLREVKDIVDQDLITASTAEGQRSIFTWMDKSSKCENNIVLLIILKPHHYFLVEEFLETIKSLCWPKRTSAAKRCSMTPSKMFDWNSFCWVLVERSGEAWLRKTPI